MRFNIVEKVKLFKSKFINKTIQVEKIIIREAHETHEASLIFLKMSKGENVSKEEIEFLRNQSIDIAKALSIIGLQAVPFSSIGIIAIETIGKKHGFTLFPTKQKEIKK